MTTRQVPLEAEAGHREGVKVPELKPIPHGHTSDCPQKAFRDARDFNKPVPECTCGWLERAKARDREWLRRRKKR